MTSPPTDRPAPLSYADRSVTAAGGSPVAAGVWVTVAGLALVCFGGCFCGGILALVSDAAANPSPFAPAAVLRRPMTWEQEALMVALYGCALACFAAGGYVLSLGVRKLLAVGR